MLYLTSFGFGVVAYRALLRREPVLGGIYLLQYGTSILHHANYTKTDYLAGEWIAKIDRLLARCIGSILLYRAFGMRQSPRFWVMVFFNVCVALIYYMRLSRLSDPPYRPYTFCTMSRWHAAMHICGTIGGWMFIDEAKRQ